MTENPPVAGAEVLPERKNHGAPARLITAWSEGAILDERGNVWLDVEYLPKVMSVSFLADLNRSHPREADTKRIDGKEYLRGERVAEIIHSIKGYYRNRGEENPGVEDESLALYRDIKNSDLARRRQHEVLFSYRELRMELRDRKMIDENLTRDEVTNLPLGLNCEYAFVRAPYFYEELAGETFNGLVVNPNTYRALREANVSNERELFRLYDKGKGKPLWLRYWYKKYAKDLKSYLMAASF